MLTENFFSNFVIGWILLALVIFPFTLKITAPYGRHSKRNWGLMISNRLGWFIMEIPSLVLFLFFVIRYGDFSNKLLLIATFLWVSHYFHRAIIFPLRIHTKGKKMPVLIMVFALFFNLVNGSINGYWVSKISTPFLFEGWNMVRFVVGVSFFIVGYAMNQYHDRILIRLRKSSANGYQIPYGGLFKYISCPNFFGEIVEWTGFAILCWSLPALAFLVWSIVNLVPRALDHHRWYRNKFEEYPKERKAIFPRIL
jgi:3-oxo-5-alpha-steroid 4-dehydrogenase 1